MSEAIPPPPEELVALMEQPFAPQRAFKFNRANWLKDLQHIPGASEAINSLPDHVDRALIRQAFCDLEDNNIVGSFIAAMIWGYGRVGYGPYRTLRVLSDDFRDGNTLSDAVEAKLKQSLAVAREEGNVAGYSYLMNEGKMRKFGPSFFTKWLYYVTATGPQGVDGAAPILDKEVIGWINDNGLSLRARRTPDYREYVETISHWGAPYDVSAVGVEERIFRIIRDDGVDQQA